MGTLNVFHTNIGHCVGPVAHPSKFQLVQGTVGWLLPYRCLLYSAITMPPPPHYYASQNTVCIYEGSNEYSEPHINGLRPAEIFFAYILISNVKLLNKVLGR